MQNKEPLKPDKISRRRRFVHSYEAKALSQRTVWEKFADYITGWSGSIPFLVINVYFFALWIILNIDIIPGIVAFDPFPFGLLTMIVSLEAIILSVFVLLSQNRSSHRDLIRDELQLQVNLISEEEITKSLQLLAEIREQLGIKKEDPELTRMLERINTSYIERTLEKQIGLSSGANLNVLKMIPSTGPHANSKPTIEEKQQKTG